MEAFHITWVTHNSRESERMKKYNVTKNLPRILSIDDEIEITNYITEIVKEDNINVNAYNICRDHVHMIIICEDSKRDNIVQKLKAVSSRKYNQAHSKLLQQGVMTPCSKSYSVNHLWAQKYNWKYILSDNQFADIYDYVQNNRTKHGLPNDPKLNSAIEKMITPDENF